MKFEKKTNKKQKKNIYITNEKFIENKQNLFLIIFFVKFINSITDNTPKTIRL